MSQEGPAEFSDYFQLFMEGQKAGASISPARLDCTLSKAEVAAVRVVQLDEVWLVITVKPDRLNVRLNTYRDPLGHDSTKRKIKGLLFRCLTIVS